MTASSANVSESACQARREACPGNRTFRNAVLVGLFLTMFGGLAASHTYLTKADSSTERSVAAVREEAAKVQARTDGLEKRQDKVMAKLDKIAEGVSRIEAYQAIDRATHPPTP